MPYSKRELTTTERCGALVKVRHALEPPSSGRVSFLAVSFRFRLTAVGFYPRLYRLTIQQHPTANFDRTPVPKPVKITREPMRQHTLSDRGRLLRHRVQAPEVCYGGGRCRHRSLSPLQALVQAQSG
jgi:hypothetical protein